MPDLFQIIARYKHKIILGFWGVYALLFAVYSVGAYSILTQNEFKLFFYQLGLLIGKTALTLFCIVLIPGITRRFNQRYRFASILMWFRRQIGIVVFLLAFTHFSFIRMLPNRAFHAGILSNLSLFEYFGLASLCMMFLLFVTSNDFSMRLLKKWWYTLHKIIYIVAWIIFGHVFLQKISFWSILIFVFSLLETISHLYFYLKSKRSVQT